MTRPKKSCESAPSPAPPSPGPTATYAAPEPNGSVWADSWQPHSLSSVAPSSPCDAPLHWRSSQSRPARAWRERLLRLGLWQGVYRGCEEGTRPWPRI